MGSRDDIVARFEHHQRSIAREMERAAHLRAQADIIEAELAARAKRIASGLPIPKTCPDCWVERGEINLFIAVPADDPVHFGRLGCTECGWYYDIPLD
jgi:hypothetical protein